MSIKTNASTQKQPYTTIGNLMVKASITSSHRSYVEWFVHWLYSVQQTLPVIIHVESLQELLAVFKNILLPDEIWTI